MQKKARPQVARLRASKRVEYKTTKDTKKILELAIPPVEMSPEQAKAFQEVKDYAEKCKIDFIVRIVE